MKRNFEIYPVLIDKVPHNLVVRTTFMVFTEDDVFEALPNTVAFSIENQGTLGNIITLNDQFAMAVGSPAFIFGGDAYMRRDDRLKISFSGGGVSRAVIAMDIVKGLVRLEFI